MSDDLSFRARMLIIAGQAGLAAVIDQAGRENAALTAQLDEAREGLRKFAQLVLTKGRDVELHDLADACYAHGVFPKITLEPKPKSERRARRKDQG